MGHVVLCSRHDDFLSPSQTIEISKELLKYPPKAATRDSCASFYVNPFRANVFSRLFSGLVEPISQSSLPAFYWCDAGWLELGWGA